MRNAFNEELIAELTACGHEPDAARRARRACSAATGKRFCAGADLTWMSKMVGYSARRERARREGHGARCSRRSTRCRCRLIGRVHGAALGGGAGLAAVCDIVVAAEDAVFGFTEVKLGILPAVISPFALAKIGARRRASCS